jgi:PAS domain S-box-containing protein
MRSLRVARRGKEPEAGLADRVILLQKEPRFARHWLSQIVPMSASSKSVPVLPGTRQGLALALATVALLVAGLWMQAHFSREVATARAAEEAVLRELLAMPRLTQAINRLHSAALSPQTQPDLLAEHLKAVQAEFAVARAGLLDAEGRRAVEPLDRAIAALQREADGWLRGNTTPADAGDGASFSARLRIWDARATELLSACASLSETLEDRRQQAGRAHLRAVARADWAETAVLALLFGVLGAATFLLWRMAGQMRADTVARQRALEELRASEAKYRSIFDHTNEGIFQTTPDGRFITANKALARMYGYRSPEHLMESLTDLGTQLYVDPTQREALLATLREDGVVSNFEFEVQRADGRSIWLRENVRAVRDEHGELCCLEGTVEDVTERWWSEQRRRLQYATARVLNEARSVAEARPRILQTICEIIDWDLGAVWDVDAEARVLRCGEIWHAPNVAVAEFEQANANTTYAPGVGLAGEVWQTGEPKWIASLAQDATFPNAAIAVKAGMGSAFGVPIKVRGEVRHVLEFFSPKISLPDPELLQTLGAISNQLGHLVERKSAEEALRASETRKAAILQSALDCIISYEADGRVTEWNPAAERTFGRWQMDAVGQPIDELILPAAVRGVQRRCLGLEQGAVGGRFEMNLRRAWGEEFPAEVALSRVVTGGKIMFTACIRDVSERKAAERATAELAAVVASSSDAIFGCTLEGVIRSWNAGAEKILGYSAEEVIGRPLHMLLPPERLDEFPQSLTVVQRGECLANYETVRLRKDGRKIQVFATDSPILGEDGVVTGISSILRDITDRRRLEEELLQSQKMEAVGRLAGGIAHDFNNVLTAILGYSDLLIGQIEERHWMWKHLNEIRKAADFAASLTQQLLAFSRRQPLFPRVFCVNESILRMEKMLQRVIGEQIKVTTDLRAGIGRVKADPGQIEQVLLNLCVNARDAMPQGGRLTIATADLTYLLDEAVPSMNEMPAGEYVKLTITDTGTGIPPEIIKHIFEPFFTTKENGQGTGLGLAMCYGIVKQSGGYIGVQSEAGLGSSFTIYLPRVEESGAPVSVVKQVGHLPGGHETILYVEDEINVRSLTAHILRRLGYTVFEAGDGAQAREVVEANAGRHIDLLFSDVVLPDLGGKELSDWIQQRSRQTRVLLCSGYIDENVLRHHGLDLETAFLQKPFTPADLARKVREVIDGLN